jgi:hypothetical protein
LEKQQANSRQDPHWRTPNSGSVFFNSIFISMFFSNEFAISHRLVGIEPRASKSEPVCVPDSALLDRFRRELARRHVCLGENSPSAGKLGR